MHDARCDRRKCQFGALSFSAMGPISLVMAYMVFRRSHRSGNGYALGPDVACGGGTLVAAAAIRRSNCVNSIAVGERDGHFRQSSANGGEVLPTEPASDSISTLGVISSGATRRYRRHCRG